MKKLIVYSSRTGNTKKVAYAIKEVVEDCEILSVEEALLKEIHEDLIIIGYWSDKTKPILDVITFIQKLEGKKIIGFGTMVNYADSDEAQEVTKNVTELVEEKNVLLGNWICQGKMDPKVEELFREFGPESRYFMGEKRTKIHKDASIHPNEEDLKNVQQFVRQILENLN